MFKSLRVPERLFQIAMWGVSLVFANFLIGLGGNIVGDLPGVDQYIQIDDFVDSTQQAALSQRRDSLATDERSADGARERASLALQSDQRAYDAAREAFSNWIATRTATTDAQQDPEVIRRTRALDTLGTRVEAAEGAIGVLDVRLLRTRQALEDVSREEQQLRDDAQGAYDRETFGHELKIFGLRLALTLPLLLLGAWMIARKRKSDYWPLYRGFVLFALVAFFVELVPYLPSYGGYIRYGVGILLSGIAGHFAIRGMRRYVIRREAEAQRTEKERRHSLGYEEALKRMSGGVCPGCERAIASLHSGARGPRGPETETNSNFCVHCGMMLYDQCSTCDTRKNAFFQYCPSCGVPPADTSAHAPAGAMAGG